MICRKELAKKTKLSQKERLNYERECYEIVIYQEVFKKVKERVTKDFMYNPAILQVLRFR